MLTTDQILAMTDNEINVEMTRADGVKVEQREYFVQGEPAFEVFAPGETEHGYICNITKFPHYTTNIHTIFEFLESHITTEADRYDYGKALNNLIKSKHRMISTSEYMYFLANATPDERCRAYLIMVNVMRGEKATE
jgi:hypothetical protein